MKKFDDALYVQDMYRDSYYPDALVDKVKAALAGVAGFLEAGEYNMDEVQAKFDEAVIVINNLQDEFEENDSEIETIARESIGETVIQMIEWFSLDLDVETAIRERDW